MDESSAPVNVKSKKRITQAGKVDGKEPPKKKEKKVKHKQETSVNKDKEVRTEEQRLKRAQKLFAISEKEFHPIFVDYLHTFQRSFLMKEVHENLHLILHVYLNNIKNL